MSIDRLFDTHTHFDVPDFDQDRELLARQAKKVGVEKMILVGFLSARFNDLIQTQRFVNQLSDSPQAYLAPGLHPFYIEQHQPSDLSKLEHILRTEECVAVGEIGLDTFLKVHKQAEIFQKQKDFFIAQIDLAKQFKKPILLHIRKSHADVLSILKQQKFTNGGIAHAFSGGVEEAKAFIKLGFKIGVTGQITNPNAKKLHTVIQHIGVEHLVIETDCPDMTPLCCQTSSEEHTRNTPANLPFVLIGLAKSLNMNTTQLADILWNNSLQVLSLKN